MITSSLWHIKTRTWLYCDTFSSRLRRGRRVSWNYESTSNSLFRIEWFLYHSQISTPSDYFLNKIYITSVGLEPGRSKSSYRWIFYAFNRLTTKYLTFNNKIIADGTRALIPYLNIAISRMLYHRRRYYGGISGVFIIINCPNNRYWPFFFQINNAWIYNWKISHKFSNSWLTIAKESVRHSTRTNAEDFVVHAF